MVAFGRMAGLSTTTTSELALLRGISPNGYSFQTTLLEPNRVSIGSQPCSLISRTWLIALTWDTASQKAIAVTSIRDWLKYDPSLPRHSRSQPGILDCLLVQSLSNMVVSVVKLL
ncbi:unnamed protein product [Penicillium nalgiovense]|nr:unnamed protein product [Penicillium nalgiovense]